MRARVNTAPVIDNIDAYFTIDKSHVVNRKTVTFFLPGPTRPLFFGGCATLPSASAETEILLSDSASGELDSEEHSAS